MYLLLQRFYELMEVSIILNQVGGVAKRFSWSSHHIEIGQWEATLGMPSSFHPTLEAASQYMWLLWFKAITLDRNWGGWWSNISCIYVSGKSRWGWFGHIDPWMLMKRERYLAPLQVRHSEDFKIVSFFITIINLSVLWGNCEKWMPFTAFKAVAPNPVR